MKFKIIGSTVLGMIAGFISGTILVGKIVKSEILALNKKLLEQKLFRELLLEWVRSYWSKNRIENYFLKNNYKHIAIYGMGDLGECFYQEIKHSSIVADYVIDRNAKNIITDIPAYTLDEELSEVDVVVVTAIQFFEEIKECIKEKYTCPIVSLEDVIFDR